MDDAWTIAVQPQRLTVVTGEAERVVFTVTNGGASPRLADLQIVHDALAAHPSWFTIDPPSVVLPGRSVPVIVRIEPRVAMLGVGERYTFGFRGRIGASTGDEVQVTVAGLPRWQITVWPTSLYVDSPGGYQVVFTVTNRGAETATVVLEAPYTDPDTFLMASPAQFHLDEAQKIVPGFGSAAFTLRVDVESLSFFGAADETVLGRVSTAGGDDVTLSPPVAISYAAGMLRPPFPRVTWPKVTEPGQWGPPDPTRDGVG